METNKYDSDLNLKATELCLGLPGSDVSKQIPQTQKSNKRALVDLKSDSVSDNSSSISDARGGQGQQETAPPPAKQQVVGWPPIRSYRKNSFQPKKDDENSGLFVKVSMDGAPYLRKIDLKVYNGYLELLKSLENMFKITIGTYSEREGYNGSEHAPTYEDKDGDWMLVGDVPWNMFISSCKRLRIMKGSEARGLGYGV